MAHDLDQVRCLRVVDLDLGRGSGSLIVVLGGATLPQRPESKMGGIDQCLEMAIYLVRVKVIYDPHDPRCDCQEITRLCRGETLGGSLRS